MNFANVLLAACGHQDQKHRAGPRVAIKIDDRQAGEVYPGFCDIRLIVQDLDHSSVHLELSSAPHNEEVCKALERQGGSIKHGTFGAIIQLHVGPKDTARVRELARAIRRVTRKGQRYSDPNWKWICPRTADSLERFAGLLAEVRRSCSKGRG